MLQNGHPNPTLITCMLCHEDFAMDQENLKVNMINHEFENLWEHYLLCPNRRCQTAYHLYFQTPPVRKAWQMLQTCRAQYRRAKTQTAYDAVTRRQKEYQEFFDRCQERYRPMYKLATEAASFHDRVFKVSDRDYMGS